MFLEGYDSGLHIKNFVKYSVDKSKQGIIVKSSTLFICSCAKLDTILMKMIIFRLFLLLLTGRAESAQCLRKPGFGLYGEGILVDIQPSGLYDLDGCETICEEAVYLSFVLHVKFYFF